MAAAKQRREEHVNSIRKLERVKERLSPSKETYKIEEEEGSQNFRQPIFESASSDKTPKSSSAMGSSPASLDEIASLYDSNPSPLHESMSILEYKFSDLRIHKDTELQNINTSAAKTFVDHEEKFEIVDANFQNLQNFQIVPNFLSPNLSVPPKCRAPRISGCPGSSGISEYPRFFQMSRFFQIS